MKADESVMDNAVMVDIKKVKPLTFAPDAQEYYSLGNFIDQAFSLGEKI